MERKIGVMERILKWLAVEKIYEGYAPQIRAYVEAATVTQKRQPAVAQKPAGETKARELATAKA